MVFPDPCPGTYGAGPVLVEAPVITPYALGALTAFDVVDSPDPHERNGVVYKQPACVGQVVEWVDDCDSGAVEPKSPTDVDQNAIVQGCPWHLYAALSCKTTTLDAMTGEVREVFNLGEQRAVEDSIWIRHLAIPGTTVVNTIPAADNALGLVGALAALESRMAGCYPGQATIHADRGVAIYAASEHLLDRHGGQFYTPLESRWAFYGDAPNTGPDGAPAPAGHYWLYATGQVTLRRWAVEVKQAQLPFVRDEATGRYTNEPYVLAERTYVSDVPCCRFAVLVCASAC